MKFGTEELHLALQKACDAGDLSYAAEILYEPVQRTARFYFAKKREWFSLYSREDQEDAVHNALLYMLDRLDQLAHPEIDGIPNYSYYANFVFNGMSQNRYRILQRAGQSSSDDPVTGKTAGDDDRERTLRDVIPSAEEEPDTVLIGRETLQNALRAFFSLNNAPETLVSVGFIILNDNLGMNPMTMQQYAEFFRTQELPQILRAIERLLVQNHQDAVILAPLKARIRSARTAPSLAGMTPARLTNRKNDILTRLRGLLKSDQK